MKDIENKEELLKRLDELRVSREFREACPFCGADSHNFRVAVYLVEIGNQSFIQYFCRRCGYSMFLNYNVVMGKTKYE